MSKKSNIAIIPARGGSKGLPGKNILPFLGKPLIAWTIEQAIRSRQIDQVIVSTDCNKIAKVARHYGAIIPSLRPPEISGDAATTEEVLLHVCQNLPKSHAYKNIVLLQCTSPIRLNDTIDNAIDYFESSQADSLLSVTKTHRFFWTNKNNPISSYDYRNRPRRQDINDSEIPYMETGSIYITKIDGLMDTKNRLSGKIVLFDTEFSESFEIDTREDFEHCEYIAREVLKN